MHARKVWSIVGAGSLAVASPWFASGVTAAHAAPGTQAPLTHSQAKALSSHVSKKVIVVFKNQFGSDPATRSHVSARRSAEASYRKPVISELKQTDARNVHSYTTINAVAATVSAGEQARLAANPDVAEVVPDQIINLAKPSTATGSAKGLDVGAGNSCSSNPAKPQLTPQALSLMSVDSDNPAAKTARSLGIDGSGVSVAYIADGVDINNPDFIRANGQHVFTDYQDFTGSGTSAPTGGEEAFIDSSSIAAQGRQVYNVQNYSALADPTPCYIRVEGVAPGASLDGMIAFTGDSGFNSTILQSIDYAVSVDHVNVLNESFGENAFPDDTASFDLIKAADDAATAAGTTVTVSSGDAGITNTIGTPSDDPKLIGVGATTSYQLASQLGYGGFQFPGVKGYLDNNISALSSSGFAQDGSTISAVAPGELNWTLCTANLALYSECADFNGNPTSVLEGGGTSESAPLTAGVAALVIQAYRKTHGGSSPTPALVKQFITSTTDDINAPGDLQGDGLVNAYRAVLAAESYQAAAPSGSPNIVLKGTSQFNEVGQTGTSKTFHEQLTNLGSSKETVGLSARTLGAYRTVKTATVTLDDTASPRSTDYQGFSDPYETVTFNVPRGADRLNGSIAFQGATTDLASRVRLALVDPQGQLADYSLPQGVGNYGTAQVADPPPGTWTAYIWGRSAADDGSNGPVLFGASVASYKSFGSLNKTSLTLKPGQTRSFALATTTPSTPGDQAGSIIVTPAGQTATTIPVTLRSLAPAGKTHFSGTLTGGNGRGANTGVTEYYQVKVPRHSPALNASVTLADDPNDATNAWLIDPNGQAEAYQSNTLVSVVNGSLEGDNELGTNLHAIDPVSGIWTLAIDFAPAVSGQALSEAYRVQFDENAPDVSTSGVPNGTKLNVNNPASVRIRVTNHGTAPEAYFLDGRTNADATYNLTSLTSPDSQAPLTFSDNIPQFLVPSQTSSITGQATTTGTEPIQFDMSTPGGDPDVGSTQGLNVTASASGSPLTDGEWSIAPSVVGPFQGTAATTENTHSSMTATTQAFDPAITEDNGDLWQMALGGPLTISPVIVQPGHSATLTATIAPSGTSGTKVSGNLYVDDDSLVLFGFLGPNANTVAAVPYSYKIK